MTRSQLTLVSLVALGAAGCLKTRCELATCAPPQVADQEACLCRNPSISVGDAGSIVDGGTLGDGGDSGVVDPCLGDVRCIDAGTVCVAEADGGTSCHCGATSGFVCSAEQFCDGAMCQRNLCLGNDCSDSEVCVPLDGECHCGGTTGPICGDAGSSCLLYIDGGGLTIPDGGSILNVPGIFGQCRGEPACGGVSCPPNEYCSRDTGICECGGNDAGPLPRLAICGGSQECLPDPTTGGGFNSCFAPCDPFGALCIPRASDGGVDAGPIRTSCFYEMLADTTICEPLGTTPLGGPCSISSDCGPSDPGQPGLSCVAAPANFHAGAESVMTCRQMCDRHGDAGDNTCPRAEDSCYPLANITKPNDAGTFFVGTCWPAPFDAGR